MNSNLIIPKSYIDYMLKEAKANHKYISKVDNNIIEVINLNNNKVEYSIEWDEKYENFRKNWLNRNDGISDEEIWEEYETYEDKIDGILLDIYFLNMSLEGIEYTKNQEKYIDRKYFLKKYKTNYKKSYLSFIFL